VTFLDTAGIRASDDPVEQEGVRRARARAAAADLVLWVADAREGGLGDSLEVGQPNRDALVAAAAGPQAPALPVGERWGSERQRGLRGRGFRLLDRAVPPHPKGERERAQVKASDPADNSDESAPMTAATAAWIVWNKIDLISDEEMNIKSISQDIEYHSFLVSATTGAGLDAILAAIQAHAAEMLGESEPALVTRERHRHALEETCAALGRALREPAKDREEIVAEELRLAARALGRLVGRVDVEDVLDVIFRDFCIGK
jgi:tRNA modification GTPase